MQVQHDVYLYVNCQSEECNACVRGHDLETEQTECAVERLVVVDLVALMLHARQDRVEKHLTLL